MSEKVQTNGGDELTAKIADPEGVKDFWLQVVKPVAQAGRLDKIPAHTAVTPRGKDIARKQNYELTKRTYGMPKGYDKIKWKNQD